MDNGIPITDLSAEQGEKSYYFINLPEGVNNLNIKTKGEGDSDIYVRYAELPTTKNYDYRPYGSGSNESVTITPVQTGVYYIMLNAFDEYKNLTLEVNYK